MARPRVFVSSTYYDLKHLRSSIENFIEQLGYEPVLSEKDSIAYIPDAPLDESCYREAKSCDLFVLIIGGRYGSPTSDQKKKVQKDDFFERYESITKREYESAVERDIPTYILIDSSVDAEYQTFLKNKDIKTVTYAHVDSVNIFYFIESIRDKQRNNPIKLFTKYSEIEAWLREQWAGTFRELIHRMSNTNRIQEIDSKVADLSETAETLKRYLEQVVERVSPKPDDAIAIIKAENERLNQAKLDAELKAFRYIHHLIENHRRDVSSIRNALLNSKSYAEFIQKVFKSGSTLPRIPPCVGTEKAFEEVNAARRYLDLEPFLDEELEDARKKYRGKRTTEAAGKTSTVVKKELPKKRNSR